MEAHICVKQVTCPVLHERIEEENAAFPLCEALVPWETADTGDCVALLVYLKADEEHGKPWRIRYVLIDPRQDRGVHYVGLRDLSAAQAGRIAPAALHLMENGQTFTQSMSFAIDATRARDSEFMALLTPAGALLFPGSNSYDDWVTHVLAASPEDGFEPQGQIGGLVQLVRAPAPSQHAAITAHSTLQHMLRWHDARVRERLDPDYHFQLTLP